MKIIAPFLLVAFASPIAAATHRTSATCTLHVENSGSLARMRGGRVVADVACQSGVVAATARPSTSAAGRVTARIGSPGQLFELQSIAIASQPSPIPEASSAQLTAAVTLDDGTAATGFAAGARWQHLSGPLVSVTPDGMAAAGIVSAPTTAVVRAAAAGGTRTGSVTISDSLPDNFGPLAGDGLPDAWQLAHFDTNHDGTPDLPFGPGADADNDGTDNALEWQSGTLPADPVSRFQVLAESQPGGVLRLRFGPVFASRRYLLLRRSDLNTVPEKQDTLEPAADALWFETDIPPDPAPRMFYQLEPQIK